MQGLVLTQPSSVGLWSPPGRRGGSGVVLSMMREVGDSGGDGDGDDDGDDDGDGGWVGG